VLRPDIDKELFRGAQAGASLRRMRPRRPNLAGPGCPARQRGREPSRTRARAGDEASLAAALDATLEGNAGSAGALRILAFRLPGLSTALRERFLATVRARKLEAAVAVCCGAVAAARPASGSPGPTPTRCSCRFAELAGADAANRSFVLACRLLAGYGATGSALSRGS
jgi:hypothetical protein